MQIPLMPSPKHFYDAAEHQYTLLAPAKCLHCGQSMLLVWSVCQWVHTCAVDLSQFCKLSLPMPCLDIQLLVGSTPMNPEGANAGSIASDTAWEWLPELCLLVMEESVRGFPWQSHTLACSLFHWFCFSLLASTARIFCRSSVCTSFGLAVWLLGWTKKVNSPCFDIVLKLKLWVGCPYWSLITSKSKARDTQS